MFGVDEAINLQFNRARWYDANTGRFASQDSYDGAVLRPATLHKYVYADANPISKVDPSGNFSLGETVSTLDTFSTLAQTAVSIYQNLFGNPNDDSIDGAPSIWDYLMAFTVRGVAASYSSSPTAIGASAASPGLGPKHHVIPIYTCGHDDQRKSTLYKPDHDSLHRELYKFKVAINFAGFSIDLLVFRKPSSRIVKTPLQRLGSKAVGRGAIAAGLAWFYTSNEWVGKGSPSIGRNLALETPRFIGKHHSAPACQRP
jgi:RHS repeat-associated protein